MKKKIIPIITAAAITAFPFSASAATRTLCVDENENLRSFTGYCFEWPELLIEWNCCIHRPPCGTDYPDTDYPDADYPDIDEPVTPDEPDEPSEPGQDSGELPEEEAFAQEVARLVNIERAKYGLGEVEIDSDVSEAALVRAKESEVSFSHTRPDGRSCFTALDEAGVRYSGAGENIAYGQKTPEEVMSAWMASPGHRANILNGNFTRIGVGCYRSGNTLYWSQMFVY